MALQKPPIVIVWGSRVNVNNWLRMIRGPFKAIAIVCGVLLAILLALPFLISLNDYIPQIEKAVST